MQSLLSQESPDYDPVCIVDYSQVGEGEESLNRCSGCQTAEKEIDRAIALRIYLVRKSDGSGTPFDDEYIDNLFDELNNHYSIPYGIHFLKNCVVYIDDDDIYNFENPTLGGNFKETVQYFIGGPDFEFHLSPEATPYVNLAVHGGHMSGGEGTLYGNYAGAGYGILNENTGKYYPRTIMHELGHVLGLLHTFRGNRHRSDIPYSLPNEELVNGSNCCTAGDFVCDTRADPNICDQRDIFDDCGWDNVDMLTDSNGDVYANVDPKNIMSYCGRSDCLDTYFTPGQGERLQCTLSDPRTDNIQRPNAIISGRVNITENTEYDTDIKILKGGKLVISNATVTMKGGRKIQVEAGGRLEVFQGGITSSDDTGCEPEGGFWEGIELMNVEDRPDLLESDRAFVKLNEATISHMERGVYYSSNAVDQPVLGRISAFNSNFVNNKTALNLVNGFLNNSPRNQVKHNVFVKTNFSIDESIPGGLAVEGLSDAVRSAYGVPIDFYGCQFSIPEVSADVAAVSSIVTRISMVNSCTTPGCEDIEYASQVEMKITGYPVGVSLMMADGSRIKNTQFIDNKVAVDAVATSRLNLTRNFFSGEGSLTGKGMVNLSESPDFLIDLNEFVNQIPSVANAEAAVALKITNSGVADAFVMNNSFQDYTDVAIYFSGINGNEDDESVEGSKIYCNAFANELIPSLGIEPSDVFVDDDGTVARTQGSILKAAGNEFSPNFSHLGRSIKNGSINVVKPEISYFYSLGFGQRDSDPSNSSVNVDEQRMFEGPDCLEQRPNVITGNEVETVIKIKESFEDHTTEMTNYPFGGSCGTCKGKILNDRNDMFLLLASWSTAIEGDTNLTDKQAQLSQIEGFRLGKEKTLGSVVKLSRFGKPSNSIDALSEMINASSGDGKGETKSLDHLSIVKTNELVVIAKSGNLFLASADQKDNFKVVAEAFPSAGSEYARRLMDFYYSIDVLEQFSENNKGKSFSSEEVDLPVKETLPGNILVYPNPVSDETINFTGLGGGRIRSEVFSSFGKLVASSDCSGDSGSISISNLKSGLYYLRFNLENGVSIVRKILVK